MDAEIHEQESGERRRSALVAVDETEASARVVEFVNDFFAGLDVDIVGINVGREHAAWIPTGVDSGASFYWPYVDPRIPSRDELEDSLRHAARTVEASGLLDDEVVAEIGDPVAQVRDVARRRHVDLIIVGDSHKSIWRRLLEGSVSDDLKRTAPCPVLVVP